MTLEEKAKAYTHNNYEILIDTNDAFVTSEDYLEQGYLAGAKENGVLWHNLKENSDDLPKDHYIKQTYLCFGVYIRAWYNEKEDEWISENGLGHYRGTVEQWCELPTL